MPHADFVHLRVHSAYSLSEGAIKIKQLVALCKAQAMPAVADRPTPAICSARSSSRSPRRDAGVQPIIGCQLGIAREEQGGGAQRRQPRRPSRRPTSWCCWCRARPAIAT